MEPEAGASDPSVWCGGSGKTAVFGVSEELVKGAVTRAGAGGGAVPSSLASVTKTLPSDAQVWAAVVIPDSVRQEIKDAVASGGQQAGMMKPFEGLKSMALSATAGSTLKVSLCADVGGSDQATQAATIVNAAIPMVAGMVAPLMKKVQEGALTAKASGSMVTLDIEFTEEDLTPPGGMAPPPGK
jgi:hypothetical protein